jgi:hypothetical protein
MQYSLIEGLADNDPVITTLKANADTLKTPLYASKGVDYLTPNEIPDKPLSTTMDASEEDSNAVIVQQNTLYAIASITAVTFLIMGIVLANE